MQLSTAAISGREWKNNSFFFSLALQRPSANFFLTIVSVVTLSQSSAQCSGISGWLPRPPFHPPSLNTEAETRRSLLSGTLWGGWMTGPAKRKIQVNKFYKMKSLVTRFADLMYCAISSFINCTNTQLTVWMCCSDTDGDHVPWAAPSLSGWLYRGWRPPHRHQPCPRSTYLTVSPGHWNNNYEVQTMATVHW